MWIYVEIWEKYAKTCQNMQTFAPLLLWYFTIHYNPLQKNAPLYTPTKALNLAII